jgi:hypothetical protein
MNVTRSCEDLAARMRGWNQSGSLPDVPKVPYPVNYAEELQSHTQRLDIFEKLDNSRYDVDGRPGRLNVPPFLAPENWQGPIVAQWSGTPTNGELVEYYADGFSVTRSEESGLRSLDFFQGKTGSGADCRFADRLEPENNFEQQLYFFADGVRGKQG